MKRSKAIAILIVMLMVFAMMPMAAQTAYAEGEDVYIVTLLPGDGKGDPIVFRSDECEFAANWRSAGVCQFYYEEDGSVAFRLKDNYCPASFTPPIYYSFVSWEDNVQYNRLTAQNTVFTAKWVFDPESAPDAACTLSPLTITLDTSNAAIVPDSNTFIISLTVDSVLWGRIQTEDGAAYEQANTLYVHFPYVTLKDTKGNSLELGSVRVIDMFNGWGIPGIQAYSAPGESKLFGLTINAAKLAAAVPGVYTGEAEMTIGWNNDSRIDGSVPIQLTLVVPGPTQTITASNVTKTYGNAAFNLNARTNGDGALTYKSANTKVATVSSAGKVTIKGAGTAKITISAAATENYTAASKTITVTVKKAANTLTAAGKNTTVKYSKLKKGNVTLKRSTVMSVSKAKGTVTYSKSSGNKKITVSKTTGKVTVKKGLKKGTYTVKVKVRAAGNSNFNSKTKTVTFKVKVN